MAVGDLHLVRVDPRPPEGVDGVPVAVDPVDQDRGGTPEVLRQEDKPAFAVTSRQATVVPIPRTLQRGTPEGLLDCLRKSLPTEALGFPEPRAGPRLGRASAPGKASASPEGASDGPA